MTTGLDAERAEVDDALTVVVATEVGVLLLGSLLAWAIAGRVLAPVRELRARRARSPRPTSRGASRSRGDGRARRAGAHLQRACWTGWSGAFASQRDFVNDAATSCARRSRSCAGTSS